jgi:hypothetical protein
MNPEETVSWLARRHLPPTLAPGANFSLKKKDLNDYKQSKAQV